MELQTNPVNTEKNIDFDEVVTEIITLLARKGVTVSDGECILSITSVKLRSSPISAECALVRVFETASPQCPFWQ